MWIIIVSFVSPIDSSSSSSSSCNFVFWFHSYYLQFSYLYYLIYYVSVLGVSGFHWCFCRLLSLMHQVVCASVMILEFALRQPCLLFHTDILSTHRWGHSNLHLPAYYLLYAFGIFRGKLNSSCVENLRNILWGAAEVLGRAIYSPRSGSNPLMWPRNPAARGSTSSF